jgi:aprataxin
MGKSGPQHELAIAAGKEFENVTKELYPFPVTVGSCYPVPLNDVKSSLWTNHCRFILHCLGPNFNPAKPDCLNGDYSKGNELLKNLYSSMLNTFYVLATTSGSNNKV